MIFSAMAGAGGGRPGRFFTLEGRFVRVDKGIKPAHTVRHAGVSSGAKAVENRMNRRALNKSPALAALVLCALLAPLAYAKEHKVTMKDVGYSPKELKIKK